MTCSVNRTLQGRADFHFANLLSSIVSLFFSCLFLVPLFFHCSFVHFYFSNHLTMYSFIHSSIHSSVHTWNYPCICPSIPLTDDGTRVIMWRFSLHNGDERSWDVILTFLLIWTIPLNYTREIFTERRRFVTDSMHRPVKIYFLAEAF
jgi:hypothetical protein